MKSCSCSLYSFPFHSNSNVHHLTNPCKKQVATNGTATYCSMPNFLFWKVFVYQREPHRIPNHQDVCDFFRGNPRTTDIVVFWQCRPGINKQPANMRGPRDVIHSLITFLASQGQAFQTPHLLHQAARRVQAPNV